MAFDSTRVVYAFIDGQNVNLGVRMQGWKLDFGRFRIYLRDKYGVHKTFLFIGHIPSNKSLYAMLERQGYILIFKPTLRGSDGMIKGNVDAELVLHTMIEYKNFDRAIIVTGDGDFYCLVEYLARQGKLDYLVVPNCGSYSSLLHGFLQSIHFMNGWKQKLEVRKTPGI